MLYYLIICGYIDPVPDGVVVLSPRISLLSTSVNHHDLAK